MAAKKGKAPEKNDEDQELFLGTTGAPIDPDVVDPDRKDREALVGDVEPSDN